MSDEAKGPEHPWSTADEMDADRLLNGAGRQYADDVRDFGRLLGVLRRVVATRDAYDAHDGAVKRWLTVQDETSWQAESRGLYNAWIDAMNEARKAIGK